MIDIEPYIDVDDAQIFFDRRLNTYAWDNASENDRLKALKMATQRIDRLQFLGTRLDLATPQLLEFPRDFQTIVPQDIEEATCLIAFALLDGVDTEIEDQNLSAITQAFSTARTTYEPSVRRDYIRNGIPSAEAWQLLLPYLEDPLYISIHKV